MKTLKTMLLLTTAVIVFGASATMANDVIGQEHYQHMGSDLVLETTNTFTFYDYGEPTVRFHESVDKIIFSPSKSQNLYIALSKFYKTQNNNGILEAKLDTNYFGFVDNIIVIRCSKPSACEVSYDQKLKDEFLDTEYDAGIIGTRSNFFNTTSISEVKSKLSAKGSALSTSKKPVALKIQNGALAPLLRDANLCDQFQKAIGCKKSCNGSVSKNPDTRPAGTCTLLFDRESSEQI